MTPHGSKSGSAIGAALGSLALLFGSLAAMALAGELVLRVSATERNPKRFDVYRASGTLAHELRPDWSSRFVSTDFDVAVHTNALGFRGGPVSAAKPPGTERILVLGDSFAFGWGVEDAETFSAVLESQLRAAGVHAQVIDAGVPGYSTAQHLIFLRERGFALDPDLILIAECGNDIDELAWYSLRPGPDGLPVASSSKRHFINPEGHMEIRNEGLVELPRLPLPDAVADWLYENSFAFRWLRVRVIKAIEALRIRAAAQAALDPGELPTTLTAIAPARLDAALSGSAEFRLRYHREMLRAIEREAAQRGIQVRYLLAEPAAVQRSDCAAMRCLDPTTLFTRERNPENYIADGHWSAAGHARVGAELARWLLGDPDLALRGTGSR
jgi:lysophospholipase L1-like esterase